MAHNERRPRSNQRGFMTIMFIVVLGLFLTFAAFALDLGNMYLWRLRIDKAARAGALAGLGYRGLQGWTNVKPGGTENANLISTTKQAVQDNLSTYGLALDPNNIVVTYNDATDAISVSVNHSPSTLLVGKLNRIVSWGFNSAAPVNTFLVSRQHQANLNRANVVLMIDVSGSMLCPETGDCSCRTTNSCSGSTKLDRLIDGVQRFAQQFNPARDRISVIPFNLAAQRLYSFGDGSTFGTATNSTGKTAREFLTDKTLLTTVLTGLAGSNTNHCDALAEGIFELETLSTTLFNPDTGAPAEDRRQLQPFVVFFTDGAPNAMRGIFSTTDIDPTSGCDTYNAGARTPGQACGVNPNFNNDFYHYALEWVTTTGTSTTFQYRGPGPFVAREVDGNGIPRLFSFQISSASVAPQNSRTCGTEVSNPLTFEQTITKNTSTGPGGRGGPTGCLSTDTTSFSFAIPYTNPDSSGGFTSTTYRASVRNVPISTANTTWRDPNWPSSFFSVTPVPDYGLQKYDELPYYCAIEAADYIRTRFGGTIFTVGLGNPSTHLDGGGQDATCNDPLQDADDHTSRKDFFLARLAFARSMFTDQLSPTVVGSHYQTAGPQQNKTVTGCSDHRLLAPDTNGNPAPIPAIGFTSADGLTDGGTTYQDLRPLRPVRMDGLPHASDTTSGARRIDTQGEYFPTNDPSEIPRIFDLIAKTILLRSSS